MFLNRVKPGIGIVVASTLLTACASQPVNTKIGEIKVQYSLLYPNGSRLKELPTEAPFGSGLSFCLA
jgi:hypothetical protein